MSKEVVIAVMPAYNAAKTLKQTVEAIPINTVDKIIVVDDGSSDKTVKVANNLGLTVVTHPMNRGYGSNQKTCYTLALSAGADIIVMIHPDYQYDSSLTRELVNPLIQKRFDVMLGTRIRSRVEALDGGMPKYKYLGNRFLTLIENVVLGLNLSEYHTGYRAYRRSYLQKLPFHRYDDDFIFDQQILFGMIKLGATIGEIPVPVRYFPEASSINMVNSIIYGCKTLRDLLRYIVFKGKPFV